MYYKTPVDPEARTLEGFCDASFAPGSERSQQCVLILANGGLVAWASMSNDVYCRE